MSDGLGKYSTKPSYITAYHKGKSIEDLTFNRIMFLEDIEQFPTDISAALSDDIKKRFDRITTETQSLAMYQHGCPHYGYTEWVTEIGYHTITLFATKHANITLLVQCPAKE